MKLKSIILILLYIICINKPASAEVYAEQEIILDFPIINSVDTLYSLQTTEINNESGSINRNVVNTFNISTNNASGSIAEFKAFVETQSGLIDGLTGLGQNNNNGIIVLTNIDEPPDSQSVLNALSNQASIEKNKNVIAYRVTFKNKLAQRSDPVFSSAGDNASIAKVINNPGNATVDVVIKNHSSYLNKTYSKLHDNAGTYQTTIYCTVYTP